MVFLAFPPTCGRARSTPNGASLSSRCDFSSSIAPWSNFGFMRIPPMEPMPPLVSSQPANPPRAKKRKKRTAFVTAAASLGPAATYTHTLVRKRGARTSLVLSRTFIPANITGWLIPNNLVSGVDNTGFDGGMVVVRCRDSCRGGISRSAGSQSGAGNLL